jgi:hypothetical protein
MLNRWAWLDYARGGRLAGYHIHGRTNRGAGYRAERASAGARLRWAALRLAREVSMNRTLLKLAIGITALALIALLAYSLERTAWLFGLYEQHHQIAIAAALVAP